MNMLRFIAFWTLVWSVTTAAYLGLSYAQRAAACEGKLQEWTWVCVPCN
jgi:hypothetical protein